MVENGYLRDNISLCAVCVPIVKVALTMILKWYSIDFGSSPHEVRLGWVSLS